MTANDSKSTPKKAERHPLALLADWLEAQNAVENYMVYSHEERDANNDRLQELTEDLDALDPAALRAQAEAEAGLREAAQAIWDDAEQMPGQLRDRPDCVMHIRCDLLCRLRDALAQAGGES